MQSNKRRIIGIDGGGTKTTGVIGDMEGNIFACVTAPSSNMKSKRWNEVKTVLHQLVDELLLRVNATYEDLACLYLSLAGGDRAEDKSRIIDSFQEKRSASTVLVIENDAFSALAAGTWGEAGNVLIAGTGSIAYSLNPVTGEKVRVGGWGYLIGDEGSGFDIGKKALQAVMKAQDGRGKPTGLTDIILSKLGIDREEEMITMIYEGSEMRKKMADFSRVVIDAAQDGDPVAMQIIEEAILDLLTLLKGLLEQKDRVGNQLVLSGGLFSSSYFTAQFLSSFQLKYKWVKLVFPEVPPVVGAFILALKHKKIEISSYQSTIKRTWYELRGQSAMERKPCDQEDSYE